MLKYTIFLVAKFFVAVMVVLWIRFNLSVVLLILVPCMVGMSLAEVGLPQPKKRQRSLFVKNW